MANRSGSQRSRRIRNSNSSSTKENASPSNASGPLTTSNAKTLAEFARLLPDHVCAELHSNPGVRSKQLKALWRESESY